MGGAVSPVLEIIRPGPAEENLPVPETFSYGKGISTLDCRGTLRLTSSFEAISIVNHVETLRDSSCGVVRVRLVLLPVGCPTTPAKESFRAVASSKQMQSLVAPHEAPHVLDGAEMHHLFSAMRGLFTSVFSNVAPPAHQLGTLSPKAMVTILSLLSFALKPLEYTLC